MCGIFGYVGERHDAGAVVLEGLKRLEYRGYDSWGVAVARESSILVDKHVGKIGSAVTSLPPSQCGIGHTRWATHGGATRENAHPHLDCEGRLAVVHNGMVSNEAELRVLLEQAGHRSASQTDTELIAHLIEDALSELPASPDRLVLATTAAVRRLEGCNAVAALDAASGAIAAAKSGSPLVLGFADAGHFLASDAAALAPHTRRVAFLEDGKAVLLCRDGARLFDLASGREERPHVTTVRPRAERAVTAEHPDFMTKETHEQPAVLRALSASAADTVLELAAAVAGSEEVFVIGCGSGFHAALAAERFLARGGHRVRAVPASEFAHHVAFLGSGSLVVALSQSGETIDVLEAVRGARGRGARVAAVTNTEGSSLSRLADFVVPLGAGEERSVLATKSFVAELALTFLAAEALAGRLDTAREMVASSADDVAAMLSTDRRTAIHEIASVLRDRQHLYVIGRGASHPLALETA